MPFLSGNRKRTQDYKIRKAIKLRMYHPHTFSNLTLYPQKHLIKRVSRVTSLSIGKTGEKTVKGSMTVEAAAAVPFFLCFFINILSIMLFFHVFITNLNTLHQQGRQLAMLAAAADGITELNGEMIELIKPVLIRPPIPLLGYKGTTIVSCCYMRAWTGYDVDCPQASENPENTYVFLTENGSVYHTRESCTHLTLSIEMIMKEQIREFRNAEGGRYTPCGKCGGDGSNLVYIAAEGDHYHNTIVCSGLKRIIRRVTLEEASGLRACSRCG